MMEIQNLGTGHVRIGTSSSAKIGIGATPSPNYHLNVGGSCYFNMVRISTELDILSNTTFNGNSIQQLLVMLLMD